MMTISCRRINELGFMCGGYKEFFNICPTCDCYNHALSFSGRTPAFDAGNLGSSPSGATIIKKKKLSIGQLLSKWASLMNKWSPI